MTTMQNVERTSALMTQCTEWIHPQNETAATVTASASTDAAAPHHDQAKATRDQGDQAETSASAPSASRDHPGKDTVTRNPPRPSEDPADATGDDERRPDTPTEPPDKPEGTRRRWGEERAVRGNDLNRRGEYLSYVSTVIKE